MSQIISVMSQIMGGLMEVFKGWLMIYLLGSLPLVAFYAAGLSGWIFDYPIGLFLGIFAALAVPLSVR